MRLFEQRIKLRDDAGEMPALGFGTLISDSRRTREVVRTAVEMGFRHLDAAERYRNEAEVGEALKDVFDAGTVRRDDLFLTTKLWNNNHRPERVKPALQASLRRLGVEAADLYLMHTPPFAFRPGDDQDPPRDDSGAVVYDDGVTLEETWAAMEELVDAGLTRAIGLSDIDVEAPAESSPRPGSNRRSWKWKRTPYHPQWELHDYCRAEDIALLAFAPLGGHALEPRLLDDPVIVAIAADAGGKTPGPGAPGLGGHPARHRGSHVVGQRHADSRELRRHCTFGTRDGPDQPSPADPPPIQLGCRRRRTRIHRGARRQLMPARGQTGVACRWKRDLEV